MASRCIAMIKDKKQWSMVESAMSFIQNSMRKVQIFEKIQAKVMEKKQPNVMLKRTRHALGCIIDILRHNANKKGCCCSLFLLVLKDITRLDYPA